MRFCLTPDLCNTFSGVLCFTTSARCVRKIYSRYVGVIKYLVDGTGIEEPDKGTEGSEMFSKFVRDAFSNFTARLLINLSEEMSQKMRMVDFHFKEWVLCTTSGTPLNIV